MFCATFFIVVGIFAVVQGQDFYPMMSNTEKLYLANLKQMRNRMGSGPQMHSIALTKSNAYAQASSSLSFNTDNDNVNHWHQNMIDQPVRVRNIQNFYPDGSALASSYYRPGDGAYQSVVLYPENEESPNFVNRLERIAIGEHGGKPYYYAVQSSSANFQRNVNGKIENQHYGETIVNDNGRITRYINRK